MLTREKELLLALGAWASKTGHADTCRTAYWQQEGIVPCTCGHDDVVRAMDYFNRNEPV